MSNEAKKAFTVIRQRADRAGKLGTKFAAEANVCLTAAFAHAAQYGDDTVIGNILDRLGVALNRKQVDAWAQAFTNFKWNKKEGTYKKPKGKPASVDIEAMTETPYYSFVKQNEIPDAFNVLSGFLSYLAKARLNTEAGHAIDGTGLLAKVLAFAKKEGIKLEDTVPTADSLAKLKAKLANVPAPAQA